MGAPEQTHIITDAQLTTTAEAAMRFTTSGKDASDMELLYSLLWLLQPPEVQRYPHLMSGSQMKHCTARNRDRTFLSKLTFSWTSRESVFPSKPSGLAVVPYSVDLDSWEGAHCCLDSFLTLPAQVLLKFCWKQHKEPLSRVISRVQRKTSRLPSFVKHSLLSQAGKKLSRLSCWLIQSAPPCSLIRGCKICHRFDFPSRAHSFLTIINI